MRAVVVPVAVLLLGGCVLWGGGARVVPTNPELERSRSQIQQAAKHPTVNTHFKAELDRARAALDQAAMIWDEEEGDLDEDDEEWQAIRHLNYMARQRTAIVMMKARRLDAQRDLQALQSRNRPRSTAQAGRSEAVQPRRKTAADLPPLLRNLQPRQDARGLVLTLGARHFEPGQARLLNSDAVLDALLEYLVANPATSVACEGYSDVQEGDAVGQRLSQQRARVVQQALLERGLEFSRVTAVGYGNRRGSPMDEGLRGYGVRVEIVISETPPAAFDSPASP